MSKVSYIVLALTVLTGAAGCASHQKVEDAEAMVWPAPPEPTRIKFERFYASSEDVRDPGLWDAVKEFFGGREPPTGLGQPYGVVVDSNGRVVVSDVAVAALKVFDPGAEALHVWGRKGTVVLKKPLGLGIDCDDRVYVADSGLARVIAYAPGGEFFRAYGREGELQRPVGVAIDEERNRLFVVDVGFHQIVVFDLESGEKMTAIGERGTGPGQFNYPNSASVDDEGRLFVSDAMNFRVQAFGPDLEPLRQFGRNCNVGGCMPRSKGIAFDSEDHLYLADGALNAIQIWDREGHLLLIFGGAGRGAGQVTLPTGVFIDAKDRVHVVDSLNRRVNVYQYVSQPDEPGEVMEAEAADEGEAEGSGAAPAAAAQ